MKKILLILSLLIYSISNAQIVNIPDTNFKNALLSASPSNTIAKDINDNYITIDANSDGEIQISEAANISYLKVDDLNINTLTGIEQFINLGYLNCSNNNLNTLDFGNNTYLNTLYCDYNSLTVLNVSNNINLVNLYCRYNSLSDLDLSNTDLYYFWCNNNTLNTLDVSSNLNLTYFVCSYNSLNNLDITNNINLIEFSCQHNLLSELNMNNISSLDYFDCSNNTLNTIDISTNVYLTQFYCEFNSLNNLDLSNNNYLTDLFCNNNSLTDLDISNITGLNRFICSNNSLTDLDTSNNTSLNYFDCSNNSITDLDTSSNTILQLLWCNDNSLDNLDFDNNYYLISLKCGGNSNLEYINLKSSSNSNFLLTGNYRSSFENLSNLQTVCVDELNTNLTAFIVQETGHPITFTEYCGFSPTQSNTINGTVNIDIDNNGCDTNDIALNNGLITSDNGTESFGTFVLADASYSLFTNNGDFTTAVTTNLPNYWSVTPSEFTNNFTGYDNTFTANFCITPNQTINDVNITLVPTSQARPGSDTSYRIVYKNVGTTQLDGTISLDFDDTKLSFLNASETVDTQTSNSLTFNYIALNPFETRTIDLEFNINTPTATQPVNIGDILNFTATINPISGDYSLDDNIFTLNQTVIGSYDPNDITCLEGDEILLTDTDKYLHYVIRFQNSGTASAINIVVKNILDAKLDWATIQLETTSHDSRVAIKNGNEVEFIFENISLPDENTDESGSHGFIAYKIKPKHDVVLGDIIPNKVDIFFDYNAAIETNIATTTVVNVLNVKENTLLDFSVYPTPTSNILTINSKEVIATIEIYTKLGQLVLSNTNQNNIDISNLSNGIYFCKVKDSNSNFGVQKVVKK